MIRFRRGGSVPGQPGHRTRTKRTDHELPKPALRAMGEVAVIGIRHGLLGIGPPRRRVIGCCGELRRRGPGSWYLEEYNHRV